MVKEMGGRARYITIPTAGPPGPPRGRTHRIKKISHLKVLIMEELLKEFKRVVFCDIDAIFLKDPTSRVSSLLNSHDLLMSTAVRSNAWPRDVARRQGFTLCSGWFAMKANNSTVNFINYLKNIIDKRGVETDLQAMINRYVSREIELTIEDVEGSFLVKDLKVKFLSQNLIQRGGKPCPGISVLHCSGDGRQSLKQIKALLGTIEEG